MRKILLLLSVLFYFAASAQYENINRPLQYVNTFGYQYDRFHSKYLMGIPADTFAVPALLQNIPFIANKSGSIYNWNISTHVWDLFSGGGGTDNANVGAFYRWLKPATQEIKTFAAGYGFLLDSTSNTDAITAILDSATVFTDIRATIEPNLIVQSAGSGEPTWYTSGDTLYLKTINDATTESDSSLTITGAGSGWSLTGNAGTTAGTNFVGTTDAVALQLKTNGVQRIVLGSTGNIGYGITSAATIEHTFSATRSTGTLALYEFQGHKDAANGATTQFSRLLSTKQNLVGFGLAGGAVSSGMIGNLANDTEGIYILSGSSGAGKIAVKNAGVYVGTGITAPTPTARLHIQAGTATASTAPLKLTSGTNLTTPEAGAVEFDGTNYFATSSTTRYTLAKTLTATATLDFDLTAVNYQDLTITVTGAADGDAIIVGAPNGAVVADVTYFGWVSGANTVTIRCSRVGGGGAANPASGTFRASVIKY